MASAKAQEAALPSDFEWVTPPETPGVNVLLYGPPKAGKTTAACSAWGPVVLLNADTPNASRYAHRKRGDQLREFKLPEYVKGSTPVYDLMLRIYKRIESDRDFGRTIVIDPIGELYRRTLEERSNRAVRTSLPIYGDTSVHFERFLRSLCEIPDLNVVFVCHELAVSTEDGESAKVEEKIPFTGTRAGSATLGTKLMQMVDIVAYCGVVVREPEEAPEGEEKPEPEVEYWAQLVTQKGRTGGDRFACLGRKRKLDLSEWFATIAASEQT